MSYRRSFEVRWSDLDANRHLRNTAYADYATHVRIRFLAENGFPPSRFAELHFGPVILREEARYLREVGPDAVVSVDLRAAGLSPDGSRFVLVHDFERGDGVQAAQLTVEGGWLDLGTRRLTTPPAELQALLARLERTADFRELAAVRAP